MMRTTSLELVFGSRIRTRLYVRGKKMAGVADARPDTNLTKVTPLTMALTSR
jgi:hypothetical protein